MLNYFKFNGSIGRVKYFEALIVAFLVGFLGVLISASLGKNFPNSAIFIAYLIIFVAVIPATLITIAAAIKRARDIEISLWWLILLMIPLANVAIGIFLLFAKGKGFKSKLENILTTVNLEAIGEVDITSTHSISDATVKNVGLEPIENFWAQALHECDSATQKPGLWAMVSIVKLFSVSPFESFHLDHRLATPRSTSARSSCETPYNPLFFVPLDIVKLEGGRGYECKVVNPLFANRQAVEFVLQEIAQAKGREWTNPMT